jgi:outer membrane protein
VKTGILCLIFSAASFAQNGPMWLTLAEAEELALRRHPAPQAADLSAQAAGEIPAQVGA